MMPICMRNNTEKCKSEEIRGGAFSIRRLMCKKQNWTNVHKLPCVKNGMLVGRNAVGSNHWCCVIQPAFGCCTHLKAVS